MSHTITQSDLINVEDEAMSQFDRIQLVVLSYNRLDCLPKLFNDLLIPAAERGVQVTLVDNLSEPTLRQFLSGYSDVGNVEIILNDENSGVAKGRNLAFRRSEREFVVYLDDDSLMSLAALERVPCIFDEIPGAGILAFRVVHGITRMIQNESGDRRAMVGNFHGAGHAIRSEVFERVGYLEEECFFGAEEIEFTMRVLAGGMKTVFIPEIVVEHFNVPRACKVLIRRRINWARNYAMVLFRYLPLAMASLFSSRLLFSYLLSGFHAIGFEGLLLPPAMVIGAFKGINSRNPLDANGVAFYSNPDTRPELGNVSVTSKVLRRLNQPRGI
jgi:GT2 family glycosyltransferase